MKGQPMKARAVNRLATLCALVVCLSSSSCSGVQVSTACGVGGKLLTHLSFVAEFACHALGADSAKCGTAVDALNVASDAAALCS